MLSFAFFSCEKDALQDVTQPNDRVDARDIIDHCVNNCGEESILLDFDDMPADAVLPASVMEGMTITAVKPNGDPAEVWVFDTDRLPGDITSPDFNDDDLLFPDGPFGNALVIQEDGMTVANDRQRGGTITVDFTGVDGDVYVNCMTFLDTEERGISPVTGLPYSGAVYLYDSEGALIKEVDIPIGGNNQSISLTIDAAAVATMDIQFLGSGAISDFCLTVDDDPGCTYTQGRWKNKNARDGVWTEDFDMTFGDCDEGWLDILNTPPKGNAYYILAHQYIAAYLNVKYFDADTDEIEAEFAAAGEWLNAYCADSWPEETRETAIYLSEVLDQFNNGYIGPGHCDDLYEHDGDKDDYED